MWLWPFERFDAMAMVVVGFLITPGFRKSQGRGVLMHNSLLAPWPGKDGSRALLWLTHSPHHNTSPTQPFLFANRGEACFRE